MALTPSGERRGRVQFQKRAGKGNVAGVVKSGWVDEGRSQSVKIRPLSGGEAVIADRLKGVTTFEIIVLSSSISRAVTTDHRAVDARLKDQAGKPLTFNIKQIQPDLSGREIKLLCEQGGSDG